MRATPAGQLLGALLSQVLVLGFLVRSFPGADNPMPGLSSLVIAPIVMGLLAGIFQRQELLAHRDRRGLFESAGKGGGIGLIVGAGFWLSVYLGRWLWENGIVRGGI